MFVLLLKTLLKFDKINIIIIYIKKEYNIKNN